MLDIHYIKNHKEEVIKRLEQRGFSPAVDHVTSLLREGETLNKTIAVLEKIYTLLKEKTKEVQAHTAAGASQTAVQVKEKVRELKKEQQKLETTLEHSKKAVETYLLALPNLPHQEVPIGKGDADK